jgi:hypothetical protein
LDEWAKHIVALHQEYNFAAITADGEDAGAIGFLNKRLGGDRHMSSIVRPADKSVLAGIDQVRWALAERKLFLCRNARYPKDPNLAGRPQSLEDEIPSYVWLSQEDGSPIREKPDPRCVDHATDSARYACTFAWGRDLTRAPQKPRIVPGTAGHILGHDQVWRRDG